MEEILFHMKEHIVGLNCGRWDYIFSYIKTLKNYPDRVLPDRQGITMTQPFLSAYSRLLIQTCHKRGAFAMGGMSAFIPSRLRSKMVSFYKRYLRIKSLKQLMAMMVLG